ncbi:TonB-dependent receptor [Yunchengibacter salinarum]|uniref:TonB-dependent receptor n=1 Tax=Yunchengibacter salinarum TaxID=3133399 RepID=UPI0035B5C396
MKITPSSVRRPHRNQITRILCLTLAATGMTTPLAAQDRQDRDHNDHGHGPIEEVRISASPLERTPFDLLQGSAIMEGAELSRRQAATIGETLKSLPGVNATSFAPGASRPVIRGLGAGRVRMLVNELGVFDASQTSPDHAVSVDALTTERIEVLRGPTTLLYGSNASAGIVNVVDNRVPRRMPEDGFEGALSGAVGTAANLRSTAGKADMALGDRVAVHASGFFRETGDLSIPNAPESERLRALEEAEEGLDMDHDNDHDVEHENEQDEDLENEGVLPNSDIRTWGGSLGVSYIGDRGRLGIAVSHTDNEYGVFEHGVDHDNDHDVEHENDQDEDLDVDLDAAPENGGPRIDMRQTRLDMAGERELDGPFLREAKVRFGFSDYRHFELEGGEIATTFKNTASEGRIDLLQRRLGALDGSYGLQFQSRDLNALGDEAFLPDADSLQWGAFGLHKWEVGDWHLEYGGRLERKTISNDTTAEKLDFTGWSGSVGAAFHPDGDWIAGVNLSRTERLPGIEELFSNGPHFATGAFEVGNPALGKETGVTLEASLRKRAGPVTGSVSLFHTDYDDFIFFERTGAVEDGLPVLVFSQTDAVFYGFEAQVGAVVWENEAGERISLDASTDLVRAKRPNGGRLPRISPLRALAGVEYEKSRLTARLEARFVDSQTRVTDFELPTDSYTLINAHLSVEPFKDHPMQVSLRANNIFDTEARNHVSIRKDRVPLAGRDIQLRVTLPL